MNKTALAALAFMALPLVGCAVTPTQAAVPAPTVTATQTTTSTPQACLDALDMADTAIDKAGDVIGEVPKAIDAVIEDDVEAMNDIAGRIEQTNDWLDENTDHYADLKAECRGGA